MKFKDGEGHVITYEDSRLVNTEKHGLWLQRCTNTSVRILSTYVTGIAMYGIKITRGANISLEVNQFEFIKNPGGAIEVNMASDVNMNLDQVVIQENAGDGVTLKSITSSEILFRHVLIRQMGGDAAFANIVKHVQFHMENSFFEHNKGDGLEFANGEDCNLTITNSQYKGNWRGAAHAKGIDGLTLKIQDVLFLDTYVHALSLYENKNVTFAANDIQIKEGSGSGIMLSDVHMTGTNIFAANVSTAIRLERSTVSLSNVRIGGSIAAVELIDVPKIELKQVHFVENIFGFKCSVDSKNTTPLTGFVTGFVFLNMQFNFMDECWELTKDAGQGTDFTVERSQILRFNRRQHKDAITSLTLVFFVGVILGPLLQPKPAPDWANVALLVYVSGTLAGCAIFLACLDLAWLTLELKRDFISNDVVIPSGFEFDSVLGDEFVWEHGLFLLICVGLCALMRLGMESIRAEWNTMNAEWNKSAADQELKAAKERILARLMDPQLKDTMVQQHREARQLVHAKRIDDAESIFHIMQELSKEKNVSINLMVGEFREAYEQAADRMAFIHLIPNVTNREPVQTDVLAAQDPEDNDSYAHYINEQAAWFFADFVKTMKVIVEAVNSVEYVEQLKTNDTFKSLDIKDIIDKFKMPLLPDTFVLKPEKKAVSSGKSCGLYVGPVKTKDRGAAKVETDYVADFRKGKKDKKPLARYVCDWLRCTIYTADPYVLALVYALLEKVTTIIRVKNNFIATDGDEVKRTNFLINFGITNDEGQEHIGEVQLTLQDYMTIKNEQHKFYEVERAGSITEIIFQPIFE